MPQSSGSSFVSDLYDGYRPVYGGPPTELVKKVAYLYTTKADKHLQKSTLIEQKIGVRFLESVKELYGVWAIPLKNEESCTYFINRQRFENLEALEEALITMRFIQYGLKYGKVKETEDDRILPLLNATVKADSEMFQDCQIIVYDPEYGENEMSSYIQRLCHQWRCPYVKSLDVSSMKNVEITLDRWTNGMPLIMCEMD